VSDVDIREIVNEALKREMQVKPEVIKFLEKNPSYVSRALYIIAHKQKGESAFLNLSDIIDDNGSLESKREAILITGSRSFSDGALPLPPEGISMMLADRLDRLRSLWALRPERINFVSLQFVMKQFKGYRWVFALILKKGEGQLLLDDGRTVALLRVSDNKILNESIVGSAAAFKIKYDNEPVIDEMHDIEVPEIKSPTKKQGGRIVVLSGINEGDADNEGLFKRLSEERADGIIILGNSIYEDRLLKKGLLPDHGYRQLARHLGQLPKDQFKIVIPGENDETNRGLPQKPLSFKLIKDLSVSNFRLLGNPSEIKLNDQLVLMYSGQGLKCYSEFDEEYAIKKMLKTRHLAPTFGVVPLLVSSKDRMIIEDVPDIFLIGGTKEPHDIMYKGIWAVAVPPFMEKRCYGVLNLGKRQAEWVYLK